MAFMAKVSDPFVGGSYMTLLNTLVSCKEKFIFSTDSNFFYSQILVKELLKLSFCGSLTSFLGKIVCTVNHTALSTHHYRQLSMKPATAKLQNSNAKKKAANA